MSTPTTVPENKALVRRFLDEVVSAGNLDAIDELFTEDVIDHTAMGETEGRDAVRDTFENLHAAFSEHSIAVEELVGEDDIVALRGPASMTHEGEFMGIEPTGRPVDLDGTTFFRIRNGKIAERWAQFDMLGLMRQLGVVELSE